MDALAKSEVFFVITSVSVVIVTVLLAIVLVYIIKILHDARRITSEVRRQSDVILSDIEEVRRFLRKGGVKFAIAAARFVGRIIKERRQKSKRSKSGKKSEESDEEASE